MNAATPLKYHGPAWRVMHDEREFIVWAPKDGRPQWQSSWEHETNEDLGDFQRGDSLAAVIAEFPPDVQSAFEAAVRVSRTAPPCAEFKVAGR